VIGSLAFLFLDIRFKEPMKKLLLITISSIVLLTFFTNTSCYGLAPIPASQNPLAKREILAALQRTQVRYAESEDAIRLLNANNATCLLLSSGKYLVKKEVADDDLRLLRAINHEDIEAIMQILAREDRYKYQGIKELILKNFPPSENNNLSIDIYVNHTIARAFEWLVLIEQGIILRNEIPADAKDSIKAIEPIIQANKHNYFTAEFWDSRIRGERIRTALNNGMIFYLVASTEPDEDWMPIEELDGKMLLDKKTGHIKFATDGPIVTSQVTLYAVRHGTTQANNEHRKQGVSNGEKNQLTPEGRAEAEKSARAIYDLVKDEIKRGEVVVVTSKLGRAQETARIFTAFVKEKAEVDINIVEDELGNERNLGFWEDKTEQEILRGPDEESVALFKKFMNSRDVTTRPPGGGESTLDLHIRAKRFLDKINSRYPGKTVIFFGHGSIIKAIKTVSGDKSIIDKNGLIGGYAPIPNAGFSLIASNASSSNRGILTVGERSDEKFNGMISDPEHILSAELAIDGIDNTKEERIAALKYLKANEKYIVKPNLLRNRIDLHCHSYFSDGKNSPAKLVYEAWKQGMVAVAIADHNSLEGIPEALETGAILGIEVIPATEVNVLDENGKEYHFLLYLNDFGGGKNFKEWLDTDAKARDLSSRLAEVFKNQTENLRRKLQHLPAEISLTMEEVYERIPRMGRYPVSYMVAEALFAKYGAERLGVKDSKEAHEKYLNIDYDNVSIAQPINTILPLMASVGTVIIAHPIREIQGPQAIIDFIDHYNGIYRDPEGGLAIKGAELYCYRDEPANTEKLAELMRARPELAWTMGSDFHSVEGTQRIGRGRVQISPEGHFPTDIHAYEQSLLSLKTQLKRYPGHQAPVNGAALSDEGGQGPIPAKFRFIRSIYAGLDSAISEKEFRDMLVELALWIKDNNSPELIRYFQNEFFKRNKPAALRIVIDGGPSAGKSTMLDVIRETFGETVACVPEAGRIMFEGGYPHPKDAATRETFQTAYYLLHRISEDYYCGRYPGKILICDRGICDGAGYWPKGKDDFYKTMLTTQEDEFARYKAIIHMESPAVNQPVDFVSDGVRGDVEASRIKDMNVREAWKGHTGWHLVEHTTFPEKSDKVLILLSEIIGALQKKEADVKYDADSTTVLLTDLLYAQLQEGRIYEIKYDTSRLSFSQIEIIEAYVKLLRSRSFTPDNIRSKPFSGTQGSKESLIAVYCTGKNFKGEGHVDVGISDGDLKEYLLRITGMVNIAIASASVPDNISKEDVDKYRPIMSYIKDQYKSILGEALVIPDDPEDMLKIIRRIVLDLPKSMRMNMNQIEEFNRLAKQALTSA